MKFSSAILLGIASYAVAQQSGDGSCDPQNDNNNDATCTGQYAATASGVTSGATSGAAAATTTNNPRISSITDVDSSVILSTTRNTDILTTSLPHSLYAP